MALVSYGVQFMKKDSASLAYIGQKPGTQVPDSDAWFTPGEFIERVRRCMGSIDLDPISCAEANVTIRARVFFSKEDSAIGRPWCTHGKLTVFINPPYGRGTLRPALRAFLDAWFDGQISQAVVLVNNATETQWFQSLAQECSALCLAAKRIAFYNTDGKECSGNTRGQVFLYFGHDKKRFKAEFSLVGVVL